MLTAVAHAIWFALVSILPQHHDAHFRSVCSGTSLPLELFLTTDTDAAPSVQSWGNSTASYSESNPRSETPSEFVVPSLWRTCPNLIGPFIYPTAPQTRSVACRAMPQSHVAPHHPVCPRAQSTRIICQCRLLNETIRGRGHLQSLRIYMCPAYKVPCFITERNSIAPVRGPSHLIALEVIIHS